METTKRSADFELDEHSEANNPCKRMRMENKIKIEDKYDQVVKLINQEFENELTNRQEEVHLIQTRLLKAQKTLHLLKYVIIKSFYDCKELKLSNTDESVIKHAGTALETKNLISETQNRIHPSVKNVIGKGPVNYEIRRTETENDTVRQIKNEVDEGDNLVKIERNENLPIANDETGEENPIRNRQKTKYQIIIGNISQWLPVNLSQDCATHKWMMYVRGPKNNPDISQIVKKVRFFLHPSYQPHDIVEIEEPPFHLSRRGWGEFPLRVQLHFQCSSNKPVDIIHNLKLDRTHTGRQTLGNETILDIWLYNTNSIKKQHSLSTNINIKQEPLEAEPSCSKYENDEFPSKINETEETQSNNTALLNSQKQYIFAKSENVIKTSKSIKQKSLLKHMFRSRLGKEIRNLNKIENTEVEINDEIFYDYKLIYLEDHCYTKIPTIQIYNECKNKFHEFKIDREKYKINVSLEKFKNTAQIVYYLFKLLPLATELANDLSYRCTYSYVAATVNEFLSWNRGKRVCSEWLRAKQIKNILISYNVDDINNWTVKHILMYGRLHAFTPAASYEIFQRKHESGKTVPNQSIANEVTTSFTEHIPIYKLMVNEKLQVNREDEDCIVDIENLSEDKQLKENTEDLDSIYSTDDRNLDLQLTYVRNCAKEVDVNLNTERIKSNICHALPEVTLLQAAKCLAEELIRKAWANIVIQQRGRNLDISIEKNEIYNVLLNRPEFDILSNVGLGKNE